MESTLSTEVDSGAKRPRFKFQLPHVYTIVFLLMIVFTVLTWVVPSGMYERTTVETAAGEREVAVARTCARASWNC